MAVTRTWQDNAAEYGALTRQGKDVRLALLVACSVQNGGKGRNAQTRISVGKTTMAEFARHALGRDTARERVSRHLQVWERMAQAGVVPSADEMTPGDALDFGEVIEAVQEEFADAFSALTLEQPTGGRPRDSKPEHAATIIERRGADEVVKKMTPKARREMRDALEYAELPEGDEYDDQPEEGFVAEHMAGEQRAHDSYMRTPDGGHQRFIDGQLAADDLAKYGHDELLSELIDYCIGLRDSLSAETLTPEMFK